MTTTEIDNAAPIIARWLAPHLAEELARLSAGESDQERPTLSQADESGDSQYDEAACALYVQALGGKVLKRALVFFSVLQTKGRVESVELATAIDVGTPRNISSNLTNSLKQRAAKLDLPWPWRGSENEAGDRTIWIDHDGIASRMVAAIEQEIERRKTGTPR